MSKSRRAREKVPNPDESQQLIQRGWKRTSSPAFRHFNLRRRRPVQTLSCAASVWNHRARPDGVAPGPALLDAWPPRGCLPSFSSRQVVAATGGLSAGWILGSTGCHLLGVVDPHAYFTESGASRALMPSVNIVGDGSGAQK